MNSLHQATAAILTRPTPEALIALQGALLASDHPAKTVDPALDVAGHFYIYLSDLQSKITARAYSELASWLDIGAVGVVATESVIASEGNKFWQRLVLGGLAEGLMVAASRQYVKGWEVETGLVHVHATWYLSGALWRISSEMQPDLDAARRWQAIQDLLAPARDPDVSTPAKALLLGRIFQMVLLSHLAPLLPVSED